MACCCRQRESSFGWIWLVASAGLAMRCTLPHSLSLLDSPSWHVGIYDGDHEICAGDLGWSGLRGVMSRHI